MKLRKSLLHPLAAALLLGCGEPPPGLADLVYSTDHVQFADVDPSAGPVARELVVENVGDGAVAVYDARLDGAVGSCGALSIDAFAPFPTLGPGERWVVTVTFTPAEGAPGGCGCFASARLAFEYGVGELNRRTPISARGTCDEPFACSYGTVEFPDAIVGSTYAADVRCLNLESSPVEVADAELTADPGSGFVLGPLNPAPPSSIASGAAVSFTVTFSPEIDGEDAGEVVLRGGGGDVLARVALAGNAERARPLCAATAPVDPEPLLEGLGWTATLEADAPADYTGTVRAFWYYGDQPPLIADYLVTSGSYADPECEVGQSGHTASWRGNACQADGGVGLFANVHAVPQSPLVEEWLRSIEEWDVVTIRGYEVDRINYDDGSWWTDAGCHTLLITWVCDEG